MTGEGDSRPSRAANPTSYFTSTQPVDIPVSPLGQGRRVFTSLLASLRNPRNRFAGYVRGLVRHSATVSPSPTVSPFTKNRQGAGAVVPLLQTFRFLHEPIGTGSSPRFIGRQSEMESLAERILFSDGGSFLVTGYRGVGKTSYVNQVVTKLEEALPWAQNFLGKTELVDVYLNVARPVQPSEIMHHIIRQLHNRLIEKRL